MKKQILAVSYWLGLISSLLAVVLRSLSVLGIVPGTVVQQGHTLWYMTFFRGALLFFLMAIATASYAWVGKEKT